MQGLFRRAAASIVALVLLAPQTGGMSLASSPHRAQRAPYVVLASPPQRIPVKEPVRVKPAKPKLDTTQAKAVQAIRAHGVRVEGPRMLLPMEIDRPIASARRRALQRTPATTAVPARLSQPGRSIPQRPSTGAPSGPPGTRRAMSLPSDPNASGTGINPWWRYQEESVPGGGHVMVNVGTGNLLLQDDDMSVPHKGIAMAFRRTYNSQNAAATLVTAWGNFQSLYGNGWTNTFDARFISQSATLKSIYDIDGARYDYSYDSTTGTMTSLTPGQHASLVFDGNCGWLWTKKSGTTYYFYTMNPNAVVGCPSISTIGGYSGRLHQIIGRNRNTSITFNYSWDNGDASINGKISQITATTESGMTTTLSFADASGRRLLQQLTFPDGSTNVQYAYDPSGNLIWVSRPPNNAAGTRPAQTFGYQAVGSDSVMQYAASPRWCQGSASGCGYDGGYLYFAYSGNGATTSTLNLIIHGATVNPSIPDGTNTSLHPGYVPDALNYSNYLFEYYTTGVSTPTFRDTDGHMTNWAVDGTGRPTQTQQCTASANQGQQCTGTWLVSNESWDADNNLISSIDPRGNETDYSYDAMGNETEVGEPLVATSAGTFKPTKMYDYDGFNNVVGYCDQAETHAAGLDWNGGGTSSDSPCGGRVSGAHWRATYAYPSYEPNGELSTMTTPLGYTTTFGYSATQQSGADYGLPTSVTGASFIQLDGSQSTPGQTFWYDAPGNLRCYSKGNGTYVLSYDSLGRMTSEADPDDSSASGGSICGKNSGQAGWNTQSTYTYFADGSKASSQTPSERAFGVATAYTYDLDGNVGTETTHHGCVPGNACNGAMSTKWYDGGDRLVEVKQTPAGSDAGQWLTRYTYDLTAGGTVTISGSSAGFNAYGNLYKTQTYVPGINSAAWTDKQGSAFDALDREVKKFSYTVSETTNIGPGALETTQMLFDGGSPAALGLLTQKTNPSGESVTYTYDNLGRVLTQTYTGDGGRTPGETYVYDPDGRKTAATSSVFGTQQYAYDDDGRLRQTIEPNGGGLTGAAQLTYSYYANGRQSAVSVASNALTQANILAYSYRADGALQTQTLNGYGGATWNKSYTDAGRLLAVSGIDTQHWTYDATGQLTAEALNSGTLTVTHDPEGSVEVETVPNIYPPAGGAPVTETLTNSLNERGELVGEQWAPNNPLVFPQQTGTTTGGYLSMMSVPQPSDGPPTSCQDLADYVNGVRVDLNCPSGDAQMGGQTFPQGSDDNFRFDATGRATVHANTSSSFYSYQLPPPRDAVTVGVGTTTATTGTTGYDAENHTISVHPVVVRTTKRTDGAPTTGTTDYGTATLSWGPNGHPVLYQPASRSTPLTLHWDGDMILFATDSSGSVVNFKVGLDADVVPNDPNFAGVSAYDRDPAGVIIASDNATGNSGMQPTDPSLPAASTAASPGFKIAYPAVQYRRSDGFQIGLGVRGLAPIQINGVRSFDAVLGTWTTPDAFEGDIGDPASQQRYMWNRNNPYQYSDPSGYDPASAVKSFMGNAGKVVGNAAKTGWNAAKTFNIKAAGVAGAVALAVSGYDHYQKISSGEVFRASAPTENTPEGWAKSGAEQFGNVGAEAASIGFDLATMRIGGSVVKAVGGYAAGKVFSKIIEAPGRGAGMAVGAGIGIAEGMTANRATAERDRQMTNLLNKGDPH